MKKESMTITKEMLVKIVDAIQKETTMFHHRIARLEDELRRFKRPFDQVVEAEIRRRMESKDEGEGRDCGSSMINPLHQALLEVERSEFEQANRVPVGERTTEAPGRAGLSGARRKRT